MEKRLFLALVLSLLVLLTWSTFVSKTQVIENKSLTENKLSKSLSSSTNLVNIELPETPSSTSFIDLLLNKLEIVFDENRGAISEVNFKEYQNERFSLRDGFWLVDKNLKFKKVYSSEEQITFEHQDSTKKVIKKYSFSKTNYDIDLHIILQNISTHEINLALPLSLGVLNFSRDPNEARFKDIIVDTSERMLRPNAHKNALIPEVKFLALRDRYFCAIIEPQEKTRYPAWINMINAQETEVGLGPLEFKLSPEQKIEKNFRIYLGPQELQLINRINPLWSTVIHYGTFNLISHTLLQLLELLYRLVHNWGWAIVILSLLIYLLLFPLTLKQMRSMKEMQALQPQVEELRRIYKDNPQKLNKEIMDLYRQHKVNPFGGCLPLILQIPIFFALYQALIRSVLLKGASFLWIKDLAKPDRLIYPLKTTLPLIGNEINILPILMAIGMFIQQKISTTTTSSVSAEQQRFMMIMFPLLFGIIFYHMPAGLVLYWFINSTLMSIYQFKLNRQK